MAYINDPRNYLVVQGRLVPGNPGLTRLQGLDEADFIELNQIDIVPGLGPFQLGQMAQAEVSIESRLALSGYPSLATVVPPIGPIVRRDIQQVQHPVPTLDYLASDGTVLTVKRDPLSGQIIGFQGTSSDNHVFELLMTTTVALEAGRVEESKTSNKLPVSWLFAVISITKDGDTPLTFGFGYCPWNCLFEIYLAKGSTVENSIRIDLIPETPASTYISLCRALTFNNYVYVAENVNMQDAATDPPLYLPAVATLWPFLDRVQFFAPALAQVAAGIDLPPLQSATPLAALVSFNLTFPLPPVANFATQFSNLMSPAIAPFLEGFVSPNEPAVAGLKSAALWLGWAIGYGAGKPYWLQELAAFYTEAGTWYSENLSAVGPGIHWPIYKELPATMPGASAPKQVTTGWGAILQALHIV